MRKIFLVAVFFVSLLFAGPKWQKIALSPSISSTTNIVDIFKDGSGVALYQFEGNANDASGTYNGTATANVTYGVGKFGQSANLNSGDITTPFYFNSLTGSISLWVHIPSSTALVKLHIGGTPASTPFVLDTNGSPTTMYIMAPTSGPNLVYSIATVPRDTWVHLVMTSNGTTLNYYVNGTKGTSVATGGVESPLTQTILNRTNTASNFRVDQVRFFKKVLSETEVIQLYNEVLQ